MSTIFTHAALPLIASRALKLEPKQRRRLAVTGALLAVLPDADMLGVLFDVHQGEPWGHRGATHSLVFAALATLLAVVVVPGLPRRAWPWLFACAASHGVIDALTHGELGVALLAPLTNARFVLPFHPIVVSPLGLDELFGRYGVLVLLNEALVVLVPAALVVQWLRSEDGFDRKRVIAGVVAWAGVCAAMAVALPGFFSALPRGLEGIKGKTLDEQLGWVPSADLPGGKLVLTFDALQPLLDRELAPAQPLWSSTFFPYWYGGAAGRWQNSRAALVWRTLTGFDPLPADALRSTLDQAKAGDDAARAFVTALAPTEKYDVAVGDLRSRSSRLALESSHNGSPRYWFGLCNGVASAAMFEPEPFRAVDVVSPRGDVVRFLPQDIKALLATSYFWVSDLSNPRNACSYVGLDSGKVCSMNAATAVLATLNRLGLARKTFLVDVVPALQSQFYAVAAARVSLLKGPYAYDHSPAGPELDGRIEKLVDVSLQLTLSSTTLGYGPANRPLPADPSRFEKVGLVPVKMEWKATLALAADGTVIGGKWTGEPANGPDTMFMIAGGPLLGDADAGTLDLNPHLSWPIIQRLARASVDEGAQVPRVNLAE